MYLMETRYSGVFEKYVIECRVYDERCDNMIRTEVRTEVLLTEEQAKRIIAELSKLIAKHGPKLEVQITEDMVEFY